MNELNHYILRLILKEYYYELAYLKLFVSIVFIRIVSTDELSYCQSCLKVPYYFFLTFSFGLIYDCFVFVLLC
jgi:hypothetical protein